MELARRLTRLARLDRFPFHMPGHKNRFSQLVPKFDATELPGLDNLHNPQAAIMRAQARVAETYGVARTFFLVNGSSVGLMAAIASVVGPGEKILVPRASHKSVVAGLIHSGAVPVWLEQDYCIPEQRWLPPTADQVAKLIAGHSLKGALFTNPDYFGFVPDIATLTRLCHSAGVAVIADEAHGAHLKFGGAVNLPVSAEDAACDIIVQSPHKTLPALTQAAWLHLNDGGLAAEIQHWLNLFHTTSPSYLLLASLEFAGEYARNHAERLLKRLARLEKALSLQCRALNLQVFSGAAPRDWTKFTLPARLGMEKLLRRAGVYPELVQGNKVLLMLTLADAYDDAGIRALCRLLPRLAALSAVRRPPLAIPPLPVQEVSPREAWQRGGKRVGFRDARGRIARQVIAPYPPGTLVIVPGQRLTGEHVDFLEELHARKVISRWIEVI